MVDRCSWNESHGQGWSGAAWGGGGRRGGGAVVGEEGPELVHFGTNAHVTPADKTKRPLAGGGPGGSPSVMIVLQAQVVGSRAEVARWVLEGAREAQRSGLLPRGSVNVA